MEHPPRPVSVRKTGSANYPWEARCSEHPPGIGKPAKNEKIYIHPVFGAVAFNTRGVGNRVWFLAQYAADRHIREFHSHG